MTTPPSSDELRAYLAGDLDPQRFAIIDAWLTALPEDEADRLLDAAAPAIELPAEMATAQSAFTSLPARRRFQHEATIGSGGMGIVEAWRDAALDRAVACKRCRPRLPNESVADHRDRQERFRREALLTARLEHPAIVSGTGHAAQACRRRAP
ncbi:MAG: hypothetical protein ACYTF0_01385 [Planctomycetota bacterium]|jgi:hypothetical protein